MANLSVEDIRKKMNFNFLDEMGFNEEVKIEFMTLLLGKLDVFKKKYTQGISEKNHDDLSSIVHEMLPSLKMINLDDANELFGSHKMVDLDDEISVDKLLKEVITCCVMIEEKLSNCLVV
ncbi:MAG: hypothetical protein GY816_06135 [Cytophagales bacterium]|nr:hypothetical protein [Cytophagales bacterium]